VPVNPIENNALPDHYLFVAPPKHGRQQVPWDKNDSAQNVADAIKAEPRFYGKMPWARNGNVFPHDKLSEGSKQIALIAVQWDKYAITAGDCWRRIMESAIGEADEHWEDDLFGKEVTGEHACGAIYYYARNIGGSFSGQFQVLAGKKGTAIKWPSLNNS
jgi:hypothetical protein